MPEENLGADSHPVIIASIIGTQKIIAQVVYAFFKSVKNMSGMEGVQIACNILFLDFPAESFKRLIVGTVGSDTKTFEVTPCRFPTGPVTGNVHFINVFVQFFCRAVKQAMVFRFL